MSDEFLRKTFQFKFVRILAPEKIKMRHHVLVVRNAAFDAVIIVVFCIMSLSSYAQRLFSGK